jgi:deoxycytidylate deaminase
MPTHDSSDLPELVFGVAGPIGVGIDSICDSLSNALSAVRYKSELIHLTREMMKYEPTAKPPEPTVRNFYTEIFHKIKYANALCEELEDAGALAQVTLRAIAIRRAMLPGGKLQVPVPATAYVVRQLKRPEEIALLRKVYGKNFMLISAYGPAEQRLRLLEDRLRRSLPPSTDSTEISSKAIELMSLDAEEAGNDYGQHLRETFHQGDVFIDGLSKGEMDSQLTRFIQAFFGRTDIAPTKQEYGMYAAKSAALRSADLSRQVGAAIFTDDGELITQGCNEVPKAMGGTYWDSEIPDYRDVRLGYDPNDILKKDILRDLFDRLAKANLLSESAKSLGSVDDMVNQLTHKRTPRTKEKDGPLATAQLMDVTEYGRVVHAEMCALCDAARLGRSVKAAILYCTTFPCHNCTKHILAAGIKRVVYIEPYPKSKAKELHQNEIEIEKETSGRVSFMPFIGISPHRYRDIFQKTIKRKRADGSAKRWLLGSEKPIIENPTAAYVEREPEEYLPLLGKFEPKK